MKIKCESWPLVLVNDNGIRPAGKQDECFYCHRYVGEPHKTADEMGGDWGACPCLSSLIRLKVFVNGVENGILDKYVPYDWPDHAIDFFFNGSGWCASNALEDIKWNVETPKEIVNLDQDNDCACSLLSFEFLEELDLGPFIEVEDVK